MRRKGSLLLAIAAFTLTDGGPRHGQDTDENPRPTFSEARTVLKETRSLPPVTSTLEVSQPASTSIPNPKRLSFCESLWIGYCDSRATYVGERGDRKWSYHGLHNHPSGCRRCLQFENHDKYYSCQRDGHGKCVDRPLRTARPFTNRKVQPNGLR